MKSVLSMTFAGILMGIIAWAYHSFLETSDGAQAYPRTITFIVSEEAPDDFAVNLVVKNPKTLKGFVPEGDSFIAPFYIYVFYQMAYSFVAIAIFIFIRWLLGKYSEM